MLLNPDPRKPAQEMLFSRKMKLQTHPTIRLINIQVEWASCQKKPGVLLDEKLNFKEYVGNTLMISYQWYICNKKLRYILPWKLLVTIYKAFLRPQIDYVDIIED